MNDDKNNSSNIYDINKEVDVNKNNQQEYNSLMENARRKNDAYWDINNPIVRIILLVLLVFAIAGAIYYFALWSKY